MAEVLSGGPFAPSCDSLASQRVPSWYQEPPLLPDISGQRVNRGIWGTGSGDATSYSHRGDPNAA